MSHRLSSLALAFSLTIAAAALPAPAALAGDAPPHDAAAKSSQPDPDKVLATVNGQPITEQMFELYVRQRAARHPGADAHADRKKILDELINLEVVVQDAEHKQIDKRPEIKARLDWQRRNLLAGIDLREQLMSDPVTDKQVKAAYQKAIADYPATEYHARHILTKTREKAEAVIKQLDAGGDFAKLAKKDSIGPTGKKGGDLGWFAPDQMVGPFAKAVTELKKGQYTEKPVKTRFGWHVIQLEGTRKASPPSLDEMRDRLKSEIRNQQVQEYVKKLRKAAKVDIKS